ncbi:Bug family tripartite tricarboxylate transporter substrate binding protein [Cupriavidus sp. 2TAF22]|uniref:Bug family tripartite tricarboxylate transporter substrate binding protein n=1 Tax=unclassified Cupriavidus TaxID=2640874 RepID=UPI003F8DEB2A
MRGTDFSRAVTLIAAALALGAPPVAAQAQTWPSRPLRLVVPFPAGGPADVLARYVGQKLSQDLHQPLVVENVPGMGGSIGMQKVAHASADGYTLGFATVGALTVNPAIYPNVGYNARRDFTPVAQVGEYENVLVTGANQPYRSLKDLLAAARTRPGQVTYGSAGNGSSNHLSGALLASQSGVKLNHIPYKGSAAALTDVMAGNVDFMFDVPVTSLPQLRSGKVRALATTGAQRSPDFPGVPTVAESVPGYVVMGWAARPPHSAPTWPHA